MRLFGRAFAGFVFALAVAAAGASLWFRRSLPQTSGTLRVAGLHGACLLYTSPSPRDRTRYRMPSSA